MITVETTKIFTLKLNSDDATMLRAMIQNPVSQRESVEEHEFRRRLFDALTQAGVSHG